MKVKIGNEKINTNSYFKLIFFIYSIHFLRVVLWQRTNMTVLEGEAVALLEALHFADANRWDRVVFESDSSTLVQALSSLGHGDSEF